VAYRRLERLDGRVWAAGAGLGLVADAFRVLHGKGRGREDDGGQLAEPGAYAAPAALQRLLGPTRAGILRRLDQPASTTHLVALTGLALGTVGTHLRILLDACLVERRRSGATVLYYRTARRPTPRRNNALRCPTAGAAKNAPHPPEDGRAESPR
jgi:DNA-binding transcriptional ArsR family regulator